jgi:isoamylase
VWHGYLPDVGPASATASGCTARTTPPRACAATRSKLLLDPYAKAIAGTSSGTRRCSATASATPTRRNDDDSAPFVPRSVGGEPVLRLGPRPLLRTPWNDTVIYEAHVKGATMRHPDVPEELRGTYAGIAHPAFVEHLVGLGVTAVELLPVHQFVHDGTCSPGACGTTGATTRSASSPRTTSTATAASPASRCRTSSRW